MAEGLMRAVRDAEHVEVVFVQRQLEATSERYDDADGEGDLLGVDPARLDYRSYWKFEQGLERRSVIDLPKYEGWHGTDADGRTVGHVALEVEPGGWLVGSGRCDLRTFRFSLPPLFPIMLAQDLALLGLVRQLDAWQLGQLQLSRRPRSARRVGINRYDDESDEDYRERMRRPRTA